MGPAADASALDSGRAAARDRGRRAGADAFAVRETGDVRLVRADRGRGEPAAVRDARRVAEALRRDPSDKRTLAEWALIVNASERTLAREFTKDTGMSFGRWRTAIRLQAALPMLAAGDAVGRVAARVGYERPSAFVAAFRRELGVTPAAYFRNPR